MRALNKLQHHPLVEKLTNILCEKTQNNNPEFFRILVAYYFTKVASMMRANIDTRDRGVLPVNMYALNLATSGFGKGHSTNIVEEQVINQFKDNFLANTLPAVSNTSLAKLAVKRSTIKGSSEDDELVRVEKEFDDLGELAFSFNSATPAAVKQMRHKLLMADAGSINMEIDEIGSNLLGNVEVFNTLLELFDVGKIKQKLTKNTADSVRNQEIDGKTPTNVMLFGTPSKLFDGAKIEDEMRSLFETGFARRLLYGYAQTLKKDESKELTADEIYDQLTNSSSITDLADISNQLGALADILNFNKTMYVSKDVTLLLIEYKQNCERISNVMPEHKTLEKAETSHRYFKALKLAGTYAFIDGSSDVEAEHLYQAIKLVEESGEAFKRLLSRDKNYVKLAKYIADVDREITHVDLVEELSFYKGSAAQKAELMALAIAYGYKNNIIIKKSFNDGIEFLKGESLNETDLSLMKVSYSTQLAENYVGEYVPFEKLHLLTQQNGYHWASHHFMEMHRKEENALAGFNLVVIDIDGGTPLAITQLLMKDYKYLIYTTKSHTDASNRYRILLPMSHTLKMDAKEFKDFMSNLFEWLPMKSDEATAQRSRKWLSNAGTHYYNDGDLLDVLPFIPKTTKNENRKKVINDLQSLSNVERWFVANTGEGNRSNQLIKYALLLVDSGQDLTSIQNNVLALNNKLPESMDEAEIHATIMVSAAKAIVKRDSQ